MLLYPLAMYFCIVYFADHYISDILAGLAVALVAVFAVSFLAPRAHAQTVEPQRWVRTAIQDAPKAPDAALADKVRTRAVRVIARLLAELAARHPLREYEVKTTYLDVPGGAG